MIDIEKLDNLPFRENRAANLARRYGDMWNVFDYKEYSHADKNPYKIVKRVLQSNIGKSFDMAFHYFCKKVAKHEQYIFLREFRDSRLYKSYGYYIDEQGNIQEIKYQKKKYPISIKSNDYKIGMFNKLTGFLIEKITVKQYTENGIIYEAFGNKKKYKYSGDWYLIHEDNIERKVISGWIKYYDSKKDREYKRYMAEKAKSFKKSPKKVLSDVEYRAILRAKVLKDREETKIKLEAKGMRPNAFTNNKTDANV